MKQSSVLIPVFNYYNLVENIYKAMNYELGKLTIHTFPDEEIMVRISSDIKDRDVIFFASLDKPNQKIFSLISASNTARELGANQIKLIVPYLPFMRQDKAFHPGEGVTSKHFAKLISYYFDELITMDPHLHRFHSLSEIFEIPVRIIHAASIISEWIQQKIKNPLIIGPDSESTQWVSEVADDIKAPFLIAQKMRIGDNSVRISIPNIELHQNRTPVIIDDIISTGETIIETIRHLNAFELKKPVCIAIHGIFSKNAYNNLLKNNVKDIVTCNTVLHETNQIDVSGEFIKFLKSSTYADF